MCSKLILIADKTIKWIAIQEVNLVYYPIAKSKSLNWGLATRPDAINLLQKLLQHMWYKEDRDLLNTVSKKNKKLNLMRIFTFTNLTRIALAALVT